MDLLQQAKAELEALEQTRLLLEQKIEAVEETIKLLEPIYSRDDQNVTPGSCLQDLSDLGLTDAIFDVLRSHANELMLPTKVRDALLSAGYVLDQHNPMAAIHTVLKRIRKRPRIKVFPIEGSGNAYCYATADEVVRTGSWRVAPAKPESALAQITRQMSEDSEK
jgi:hypothetical protein